MIPIIQKIGINGMMIKDHGAPGFSNLEQGAILFEIAKYDASVATLIMIHNLGMACFSKLGDEE